MVIDPLHSGGSVTLCPEWLKAPAATHVEWNCAMMAVWVHLSDILSWLPLFKYYSQPLMSHFFVLHTSNDPNDLIEGYGYAWRSTVLVFVVGPRRERRVPELSFNKRPQFMYICSQRGCLLLLNWSFKSARFLDPPSCAKSVCVEVPSCSQLRLSILAWTLALLYSGRRGGLFLF